MNIIFRNYTISSIKLRKFEEKTNEEKTNKVTKKFAQINLSYGRGLQLLIELVL